MTILLTAEQEQEIASIASESERSAQDIVRDVVQRFLVEIAESKAMLARADAEIAAGRVLSHEQVWHRLEHRFRS